MKKKTSKLSTGSLLALALTLLTAIACIWVLPKLFGDTDNTINVDTVAVSSQEAAELVTAQIVPKKPVNIGSSGSSDLAKISLRFAGIVNYNQKVQETTVDVNGVYHSTFIFDYVKNYLDSAYSTATIINTFVKNAKYNDLNASDEILLSLKQNGFNLLGAGGRNLLNKGTSGLDSILEACEKYEINVHGINTKKAELPIYIETIQNVKVAFLQYSQSIARAGVYAINGANTDRYIRILTEERVKHDIAQAKSDGAQIVVVNMLWNSEPDPRITDYQRNAMHIIANAGADLIIGSNLTTAQPFEIITAFNSNGTKRDVPVVYSLGTLLDSDRSRLSRICSILLHMDLEYNLKENKIASMHFDYTPLFIWKNAQSGKESFVILDAGLPALDNMSDEQKESMNKTNAFLRETFSNLPMQVPMQ